jgi:DNA-binding response OmpR family regulator
MTLDTPSLDTSIAPAFARPRVPGGSLGSRPARILVAEDDADTRWLVATALRCDGHDVIEARDGGRMLVEVAAAYGTSGLNPVCDMFVSDICMPVCNGIEILEAVRRVRWNTPYIVMTAFADPATRRHIEGLGALLFEKPFDIVELRTAVRKILARV